MSRGPLHILLTGAASGLGRGLALHFAGQGHRLVLADKDSAGLTETPRPAWASIVRGPVEKRHG